MKNPTFAEQVGIFNRLQKKLGWRLLRDFSNGTDRWIQRNGIAVWVNERDGLQIGFKNRIGGYSPLTGLKKRSAMTLEQVVALWIENSNHQSVAEPLRLRLAVIIGLIQAEMGGDE